MNQHKTPTADKFRQQYDSMKADAQEWQKTWKELSRYIAPTRGFFDTDQANDGRKIDHRTLIDSDPLLAVEVLSAGMVSGLTNPSRSWFELTLSDGNLMKQSGVRNWLYEVRRRMEEVFSRSNLYHALHGFYQEISVFGTAAFLLEEDFERVISCRTFTAGEYVLGCNEKGQINSFGREFFMTPAQIAEKFGKENLPLQIRRAAEENRNGWFKVIHVIMPNENTDASKSDNLHMPYLSGYFTPEGKLLKCGGYHEFPVIAARWEVKNSSDIYGRGPGWKALGDVKMLQKMQKTKLIALDKNTNPPMMVSSNVQGEVNLLPGGLTRYNGTTDAAVKPAYQVPVDLNALEASIDKVKRTIQGQFFADVFLMLSAQNFTNMTATEVAERHQEKMLVLGPVLERLKNELLDPLIERTFAVMNRRGVIPLAPSEIQGADVKIQYVSMIAQAQKQGGMAAIHQGIAFAASLAQGNAEVLDKVDFDAALEEGLDLLGVPPVMLRSQEDTQKIRQQRAEAQALLAAQAAQQTVK
ncbi:MAG: head-tail connector protein [Elusimicrobiaceae bacterium]|nr:head-tail connector protein [Elusimicrobiaceae bacterium]